MNLESLKRNTNQQGNEKQKQQDSSKNNANGAIINEDQQKGMASFLLSDGANQYYTVLCPTTPTRCLKRKSNG